MAVDDYRESLTEAKSDLTRANELVKEAKLKTETALNKKQRREAYEELSSAKKVRAQQQSIVDQTKRAIDIYTHKKLQAMRDAPIESKDEEEIIQAKRESYAAEAAADLEIEGYKKQMVQAPTRSMRATVAQRIKSAKLRKSEAQIKRERAYAEEEKSDESSDLANKMDAHKI